MAKESKLLRGWDSLRFKEYLNELFMSNLARDIKILLTDQQIYDMDSALSYLRRKENLILSEYKKGTIKKHNNSNTLNNNKNKTNQFNSNKRSYSNNYSYKTNNSSFDSRNFSDSKHQNSKNSSYSPNKNKAYTFIEPSKITSPFELKVEVAGKPALALIDTGATDTYVSSKFLNKIGILSISCKPKKFETADGRQI